MTSISSHNNDDINDDFSVVEELNAEPESEEGRSWWRSSGKRETALGLLILLALLSWARLTWWRDESNRSSYAQATDAVSHNRWDEALAHYSAASGYRDDDARAAEARGKIVVRDREYEAVKAYTLSSRNEESGAAIQMLLSARAVQTIQPGHNDIDEIALEVEDRVYSDTLSGTVVWRTRIQARRPGSQGRVHLATLTKWARYTPTCTMQKAMWNWREA